MRYYVKNLRRIVKEIKVDIKISIYKVFHFSSISLSFCISIIKIVQIFPINFGQRPKSVDPIGHGSHTLVVWTWVWHQK